MDLAPEQLAATRRSLHGVAETVLAGPQHRRSGTIRLRVVDGGFATVAEPVLAVIGADLVAAGRRVPLTGTYRAVAEAAGLDWGPPRDLYADGSGVAGDEPLSVEPVVAEALAAWLARGAAALRRLAPEQEPVLWPEHFDVGISVDEVNYGVSPGDAGVPEPYAYVGPWTPRSGEFWNAPFGAVRTAAELPDADALLDFLTEGRRRARDAGPTG